MTIYESPTQVSERVRKAAEENGHKLKFEQTKYFIAIWICDKCNMHSAVTGGADILGHEYKLACPK